MQLFSTGQYTVKPGAGLPVPTFRVHSRSQPCIGQTPRSVIWRSFPVPVQQARAVVEQNPSTVPTNLQAGAIVVRDPNTGLSISNVPDATMERSLSKTKAPIHNKHLPFMLMLPDMDGVGVTSAKTWAHLATRFDLHVLRIDTWYCGSFQQLVDFVVVHLQQLLAGDSIERPVYLVGEGFGGVLALAVILASKRQLVSRAVLVNPCTCIKDVPIRRVGPLLAKLPESIRQGAPLGIAPLLGGSPTDLIGHMLAGTQGITSIKPEKMAMNALQALISAVEQLQQLAQHLPPATLANRLALLDEGLVCIQGRLHDVEAKVMIMAGGKDALLPSVEEAKSLARQLPRAFVKVFPGAGHALLLDPSIDLVAVMQQEGFLLTRRAFTSPVKPGAQLQGFGAAGPIELPSREEVARVGRDVTGPIRRLCSPVFTSTLPDGTIVEGLEGLDTANRPLLFVGNHQLYAMDMNVLVEEVFMQKGVLLRGLAHPMLFANLERKFMSPGSEGPASAPPADASAATTTSPQPNPALTKTQAAPGRQRASSTTPISPTGSSSGSGPEAVTSAGGSGGPAGLLSRSLQVLMNNVVPKRPGQPRADAAKLPELNVPASLRPHFPLGDIYRTFGAVVVTGTSFFKLLAAREAVLLYPGGVREGFKRKHEKYELFWPEKSEFVRMAARHGTVVIPVSSVGWEDCIRILMDTDEMVNHPVLGQQVRAAAAKAPVARDVETAEHDEMFVPPLVAPSTPARLYFHFGRPVHLEPSLCQDRAAADTRYAHIKTQVQAGIRWLLHNREQDPYKDVLKRLMYENNPLAGGRRQAPSFPLTDTPQDFIIMTPAAGSQGTPQQQQQQQQADK